jgi:hypothetical protein
MLNINIIAIKNIIFVSFYSNLSLGLVGKHNFIIQAHLFDKAGQCKVRIIVKKFTIIQLYLFFCFILLTIDHPFIFICRDILVVLFRIRCLIIFYLFINYISNADDVWFYIIRLLFFICSRVSLSTIVWLKYIF